MDVSADLTELGRSAVAVVSSGVKSILDIGRTLEYLETQGVCVAAFGRNARDFPAFYTRSSGVQAPYGFDDAAAAAAAIDVANRLRLRSGTLIGVPVPEEFAMDGMLYSDNTLWYWVHYDPDYSSLWSRGRYQQGYRGCFEARTCGWRQRQRDHTVPARSYIGDHCRPKSGDE